MAYLLFLGVFTSSCFVYNKFFSRFLLQLYEHRRTDEGDSCPSCSAGQGVLREKGLADNRRNSIQNSSAPSSVAVNNSSKTSDVLRQNQSTKSRIKYSSYVQSGYQ